MAGLKINEGAPPVEAEIVAQSPQPAPKSPNRVPKNEAKPKPQNKPEFINGVERQTYEAINAVELSEEEYREFLTNIDKSNLSFAETLRAFDPRRIRVPQGRSEIFIWHLTTFYMDYSGATRRQPHGKMNVKGLLSSMNNRDDDPADNLAANEDGCCAINWTDDRQAIVHQLTPLNLKVAHAYPFNSISTGLEFEATYDPKTKRSSIITKQYETVLTCPSPSPRPSIY